jgi:cellulose synthase operon protein YhjQ
MKIIAVTSTCGGVGKTTLVASMAVLLARRQVPALAIELSVQNMLGTFLGLPDVALIGLLACALDRQEPWRAVTYRNEDGVLFVPFGRAETADSIVFDAALASDPDWLADRLRLIDLPENAVVLLDAARLPDVKARQALHCADLALCVTRPEPLGNASLVQHLDVLRQGSRAFRILVNGVSPAHPLHYDMLTMLRARVGSDIVLPLRIHLDSAVPESYAHGVHCFDFSPHSQASHDLQGLANWLAEWVKASGAH